jgi:predicted acetyltransferase
MIIKKVFEDYSINRMIITRNPNNYASRRTCEMIGEQLIETIDIPETSDAYSINECKSAAMSGNYKRIIIC